jgi:chromate reductase, NAD(P)H dehydrogenase (quinone)
MLGSVVGVTADMRQPVRIFVLSGSRRTDSLNTQLARLAATVIEANGATADLASLHEFDVPLYDGDREAAEGIPAGAAAFRDRLGACDGFVLASPEYNGSMPGVVKNLIDWTSRFRPQPFIERHCLLMSASPSMVGGNRGLWALRVPLEHLGTRVYPDMFSLAQAHTSLDADGEIANEQLRGRFATTIVKFLDLVEASTHYPCVKREWVEFLGEHPDPVVDRVDTGEATPA